MTAEEIIADLTRAWVEREVPGDQATADAAVAYALASYTGGASVSEACEGARRMAASRSRHPSCSPTGHRRLRAAS